MTSRYHYRCNRCRTRNVFRRLVERYVIARSCRDCGHRRFYVDRERWARVPCRCDGYHYAHRPGSPMCVHNPQHNANRARAQGCSQDVVDELSLDAAFTSAKPWRGDALPF